MPEVISLHERQANRRAASRRAQRWGRRRLLRARFGWPLAIALGSTLAGPVFAQNLPQGGTVTGGSGTIQQINANLLQIQQNSQNLAIDWQSFNVGPSGIVRFLQPSSSAIALNRVIGNDPSMIFGQIQANGQVILLNPRGIYFGPNSMVDVNALVATTANIRNDDFMAGRLRFEEGSSDPNARVINEGLVSVAQGGFAILAAAGVQNTGRIVANGGSVVLAGTKTFTVDFHGDGLLSFAATGTVEQAPSGASALVDNSGIIEAAGGRVLMTARAARDVLSNVINTTGIVVAHTAQMVNGEIVIDGGDNGIVNVNGLVDASGRNAGETGGTVKVLGEKVGLFANARIDASGDAGGGTVLVGGNYQGQGPEANAKMVYMDAAAMIDASAVTTGNGGKVILWSDVATRNSGHINVSGANDGGFVEVSSKGFLDFRGTVDLAGRTGRAGSLLLDPTDITITSGASSGDMSGSSPFAGTNASSNLDVSVLNAALTGGTVTVTTASAGGGTGNIDITASIVNGSAGTNLILRADGNITIGVGGFLNAAGNAMNVSLRAGGNITVGGIGISLSGGTLTTTGVGGTGNAGGNFSNTALITTGAGAITLNQAGSVTFNANVSTTSTLTINADGTVTQPGGFFTGPLNLAIGGTGTVNLNDLSNSISNLTLNRTGTSNDVTIATSVSPNMLTSTLGTGYFTLNSSAGFVQTGAMTQDAGGNTVAIVGGTGSITLSSTNTFTGPLVLTGDSISVTAAQTADSVTLQPYTPGTNVIFNGSGGGLQLSSTTLGFLSGATYLTAGATTAGTLTVGGAYTAGSQILGLHSGGTMTVGYNLTAADLTLTSGKNVSISADLTTGGGDIYIAGNVTSWAAPFTSNTPVFGSASGTFAGVSIGNGVDINAGGGSIAIAGKGGDTGADQYGIQVSSSASNPTTIATTGAGTITLVGQGGPSATYAGPQYGLGGSHAGLRLDGAAGPDYVDISAQNGNIKLVGTGGGATASDNNDGIDMFNVRTRATGTGSIDITGVAGLGASRGIVAILPDTQITTVSGDITMTGTGGGNYIIDSAFTGNAKGIELSGATIKSTGSGDILLNGIEGAAGPGLLINTAFGTTVLGAATMTGDLTIKANSLTYSGTNTITHQNGTGVIAFETHTNATSIGVNGGAGTLQVGSAILGDITNFGTLEIGSGTQSGNITFAAMTPGRALEIETTGTVVTNTLTMGTNALTISNGGTYTQFGGISGSGLVTFEGAGSIAATHGSNSFTNVAINVTGSPTVSVLTTGTLDIAASTLGSGVTTITGAFLMTQSGAISGTGTTIFNGGTGSIVLSDTSNALTGPVRFNTTGSGNVTFHNNAATLLGGGLISVGGDLTVTSNGALTQSGALAVGGNASFDAQGNTLTLTDATNAVTGNVAFTNAADTVSWREAAAVSLAASTSTALSVQAGGAITQTGALTVTGAASFTAGANAITLTNGSNAFSGSVTLVNTGANNVQLTNAGAIDLNGSSVGGNLTLIKTGAGDITQSSPLTVGGTLSADAGSGLITLNQGANSVTGAVSLSSTNVGTSQFQNGGPLVIGTINLTGNLDAIGNSGAITQSGVITTGGDATFTTGGYAITLANASNAVGGNVSLNNTGANAVSWQEAGAVSLAASGVGGDLTVQSGGAITQTGALTVGGNASFTTGAGALTLSQSNSFTGDLTATADSITISAAQTFAKNGAQTASLTSNAGNILVQGGLSKINTGGLAVSIDAFETAWFDNAGITSNGGNITIWGNAPGGSNSAGALAGTAWGVRMDGASALISSGAGTIDIVGKGATDAGSGQHGVVFLNSATVQSTSGAITIQGRGGDGTGTGAQGMIIASGSVSTQTGNVTLTGWGGANSANGNGISLDNGSSIVATTGGALSLTGTGTNGGYGLTAAGTPSINAGTGTLSFTSNNGVDFGLVTLSGSGGATFTGGAGSIAANNVGNQLSGTVSLNTSAGNASVLTMAGNSLDLGTSGISGDLNVTSGGALTQSGTLTVGGNSAFVAGSATLDLATNGTNNSFGGTVTLTNAGGANVLIASTGGLTLGAVTTTGDLTATANAGTLTLSQANSYAAGKNVSLEATGAPGTITISADQTLSNGNFTAVGSAGVVINASVDTGGGNVTIWGNSPSGVANGATAGSFFGVNIDGATAHIDAGGGNISIVGAGGTGNFMHGVSIRNAAYVETSGSGTITITGQGGSGAGGSSFGVEFYAGGSYAQTQNGALAITGTGGAGGGDGNIGVAMATGEIRATGTGTVTVTGTGGAGGSAGINLSGGGPTVISAVNGNMVLLGTGGSGDDLSGTFGGLHSWGINLANNADVKTTGSGNLSVTANGGTDGVSDYRMGMVMQQSGLLRATGSGSINIVANGGTGSGDNNMGFYIRDTAAVASSPTGTLSITGTGGGGSGVSNTGVLVESLIDSTGTGAITVNGTGGYGSKGVIVTSGSGAIQSTNGNINVTGTGGATGATNDVSGIRVENSAVIESTGTGNVTLTGTGGATSGSGDVGVFVYGGTAQTATGDITVTATGGGTSGSSGSNHGLVMQAGGQITSTSGDINITGDGSTGGGSGNSNYGVTLDGSGTLIQTGGSGFVTIYGTGGTATGGSNTGIQIATGSIVAVSAGNLTATGTGGGGNSTGVLFNGGGGTGGLLSSGAGAVVINGTGSGSDAGITAIGTNSILGGGSATGAVQFGADSLNLGSSVSIQTTNQVRFNTQTAGLSLGINNSGSAFNLTSATIANVSPTASLIVLGDVAATGTITVGTDAANNFTTGIALRNSGGANPINIVGALSTAGDLDVSAGGAVTQTGALTVGGTSYFNSGGNVTLTNVANAMSGDIGFSVMSGNIALANSGATSFSNSFTTGTLSVSVTGGTVSQTGVLNVTGAATVTSDAAIAWNNASNAFGGPLNITTTSGANATVYNSLATTLNTVSVAGNLDVASASTLGQGASPLTVGGTSHFSSVGATTLADASNSFGGAVSLMTTSGGNATIAATGQLILGSSTIAGNFLASVGSPMSQTGALAVSGTAGFTASNGPLTLTNTSNTFGGAVTLTNTGNFAVGIAASGALTLGDVTMTGGSTGGFTATATNGITQSGGTTIQAGVGPTVLAGGGGQVVLGETGNSFGSTVSLSGTGGTLAGFVNGQTGAAAAPFVTATGGIFSVNGTSVGSTPVVPTTPTGTQAVLNEIAQVAPVDSATRVDTPQTNNAGLSGPAFESTNTASTGDLSGGQQSGGENNEEQGTTNVAGGPQPPAPTGGQGPTPPSGPGAPGGPQPPTILVSGDTGPGGQTTNDVNPNPSTPQGPVSLVPGVLTSVPGTPPASGPGTPGITQSFPQQGNSSLW